MPDSGISLTIRDLARYGALFARRGRGIHGRSVGSPAFIDKTLVSGIPWALPPECLRYSNMTLTNGKWLGHSGYGGQFLLVDLTTGTVGALLSVLEGKSAREPSYYTQIIDMLQDICRIR
jgi:CubicO group peptidase (beta-lactamase class C family)